jgi:hypothetical protein
MRYVDRVVPDYTEIKSFRTYLERQSEASISAAFGLGFSAVLSA